MSTDERPITSTGSGRAASENGGSVAPPRDERSGPITAKKGHSARIRRTERARAVSSVARALALKPEQVEKVFSVAERFLQTAAADDLSSNALERALGRARELERLGDQCAEDEKVLGREKAYELYGTRSFPVADGLARYDVRLLVEEIKRLRGWS
jgi:hypothetical protein